MGGQEEGIENLEPLPTEKRTWHWYTYAAMWVAMGFNAGAYSLGGSLVAIGLSPVETLTCSAIGFIITTICLIVNSVPGASYGIPFPVYARASFGVEGAKYAALSRGVVAVFWLSFQMWLGANSLLYGFASVAPGINDWVRIWNPYLTGSQLALLLLMAFLFAALVAIGVEHFGRFSYVMAPFAVTFFIVVAVWAVAPSGGGTSFAEAFRSFDTQEKAVHGPFAWIAGINAVVSYWSTMMLNMADLARLAPSQQDHVLGQVIGVPIPQLCAVAVGVLGASAVLIKNDKIDENTSWYITSLFAFWPPWASVIGGIVVMATLVAVNIGANIIPPANDFLNLCPARLRWRWCAYATIVLSVLVCPFYIYHTASGFALRFLGGYGMVTGAIYGIMVTDYYVVRRGRLGLSDLYPSKPGDGACAYWCGHNWRAVMALVVGIAFPLPQFVAGLIGSQSLPIFFLACQYGSWFVACAVSSAVYLGMCSMSPPPPMCVDSSSSDVDTSDSSEGEESLTFAS